MSSFIRRFLSRTVLWHGGTQQRAGRRKSGWNLILLPLALVAISVTWFCLFKTVWAFHVHFYPDHDLHDFWKRGIPFASFVPSFLMVFAIAPGAVCTGLAVANCITWLIQPARRALDRESSEHPQTGFAASTRFLFRCASVLVALGLVVALGAAYFLRSLR